MIMTIWWDYEHNPSKPWRYNVVYLGETEEGCGARLKDCWLAVDAFICVLPTKQDNEAIAQVLQ